MAVNKFLTLDDASNDQREVTAIATSAGAADAFKVPMTGADGLLDPSLVAGQDGVAFPAGEALLANDLVYTYDDAGTRKIKKAIANDGSKRAVGFVKNNVALGASATVFARVAMTGLSALTPGQNVFLSASQAGKLTQAMPTGTPNFVQVIGQAISATQVQTAIQSNVTFRA